MEEDKIRIRDAGRLRNTLANKLRSRWHRHKNTSQRLEQETPQILIIGSSKLPPTPTPIPPSPSPDLLPVELWVVIFQNICRDTLREHLDRDDFYDNSSRLHLTPITLSHVCRSWNQVILSHPLFWANLFVYVGARFSEPLLELWLARSETVMLSIWVYAPHAKRGSVYFDAKAFFRCIHMLHSHSRRWKTVSFNLCDSAVQLWQTIFMTIESDGGEGIVRTWRPLELPELEEVEVMMLGYTYVGKEIDFVSEVCSNSRLHSIKIRGPNKSNDIQFRSTKPYQPSASIISSLSNLSLRNIRMPSAEILVADLSKAAHVQFLEICDPLCIRDQLHADTLATPRRTELDHITRLSVVSHGVHNAFWVSLFFQSISLPSLEDLTAFLPGDPNSVHEMIEASQCNIRKLTIKINARGIEEEMAFLSTGTGIKQLLDLTIETTQISDRVQVHGRSPGKHPEDYIVELSKPPWLVPTLARLSLIKCRAEDGYLAELARSRLQNGQLSYLYVDLARRVEDHQMDLEVFRALHKSGFHAYITSTCRSVPALQYSM